MIRIIIERHAFDNYLGHEQRDFVTRDVHLPEIEALLRRGGKGDYGFESWRFIGVEIIEPSEQPSADKKGKT